MLVQCAIAHGNKGIPNWKIPTLNTEIQVDGILNEHSYQNGFSWNKFVQTDPGNNISPSRETEIFLFKTNKSLIIGIKCFDPHPEQIRRTRYRRDQMTDTERVEIALDTFGNAKQMYFIAITPENDVADGLYDVANGLNSDYDLIFQHATRITKVGWTAELVIPFSSLSFGIESSSKAWLFQVSRYIPRVDTEEDSMLPIDRNSNDPRSGMARLEFDVPPRKSRLKRWQFFPSLVVSHLHHQDDFNMEPESNTSEKGDLGITFQFTPSYHTNLKATFHPDFSQVEADDTYQRINNRYPVYFAEKRPFFMDGMESFATPLMLLHTRTIVNPEIGIKFSTKGNRLGLFGISALEQNVPAERFGGANGTNDVWWNVLRGTWKTNDKGSFIGGLITQRNFASNFNRVVSLDGVQRTQKLTIAYQGAFSTTTNETSTSSGNGLYLNLGYKWNQYYSSSVAFTQISPEFQDDAGFLQRVGFRTYSTSQSFSYAPRTDQTFLKNLSIGATYSVSYNYRSVLIDQGPFLYISSTWPHSIFVFADYSSDNEEYNGMVYDTDSLYLMMNWTEKPWAQPQLSFTTGKSILYGPDPKLVNLKTYNGGITSEFGKFSLDVGSSYYTLRNRISGILERRQLSVETILNFIVNDHINFKVFHISDVALFKDYDLNEPYHYFNFLFTWQKNAFSKIYVGITNGRNLYRNSRLVPLNFQEDKQFFAKITWLF